MVTRDRMFNTATVAQNGEFLPFCFAFQSSTLYSPKRDFVLISVFGWWRLTFFSELCRGKALLAYIGLQQWKNEESKRLRGEGHQIKLINLRFER